MVTTKDFTIRKIKGEDTSAIVEIDGYYTGETKGDYWEIRLKPFIDAEKSSPSDLLGYVALKEDQVSGYVLAEVRAWEFGSFPCGWIFAVGIHPDFRRHGVALALCRKVCLEFKSQGIHTIRTMVRKDDVSVLSFFRASGFQAGPFVELELNL